MAGKLDFSDLVSGGKGSGATSARKAGKLSFDDLVQPQADTPAPAKGPGFLKKVDTVRKQVSGDIVDDKAWDISRQYLSKFKPEDLKTVYGSDNVEEIIAKQQKDARHSLALIEAMGQGALGITPTQPKLREEHPISTTVAQIGAGVAPYFIPGGTIAKFTAIPAAQEVIGQATNPDDQLNPLQRAGRVGAAAGGGFITGKIFGQADLGKTVFNRVLQRSVGAGSTAITENILKDAISGHTPDVQNALINGGINAASIGILGALVEIPQLRSAVIKEGSKIAGKPVAYKDAVKIVKGNMINPETLSPTFQEAQYQQLRSQAVKQIETETGRSINDRALKDYLIQRTTQERTNLFDSQAAKEVKLANMRGIDPATGFYAQLLPYRELIINGADPVDLYMSMRLADNLKPQPPIVQVKPAEPVKPPGLVEAEKAGKVIGIDKKTNLPVIDTTQKPIVPESTPITPSTPATVVSKIPQIPAVEVPDPVKLDNEIIAAAQKITKPGESLQDNVARTKDWISSTLDNDPSNKEDMVKYFMKEGGFSEDVSKFIVSKRAQVQATPLGIKKEINLPQEVSPKQQTQIPKQEHSEISNFYNTEIKGKQSQAKIPLRDFNVGVLPDDIRQSIGASDNNIHISSKVIKHISDTRPEITEYIVSNLPNLLDTKDIFKNVNIKDNVLKRADNSYIFVKKNGKVFSTVIEVKNVNGRNEIVTVMTMRSGAIKKLEPFRVQVNQSGTTALEKSPFRPSGPAEAGSIVPEGTPQPESGFSALQPDNINIPHKQKDVNRDHLKSAKGPSASGSVQGFAKEHPIPAAPGTTPSGSPHVMELPEMVKLATDLMGKPPVVKKLVSKYGYFKGYDGVGTGTIALDTSIFKNPYFASAVLGHEVGHLIDWLPEKTMTRGNLLGRLLILRGFLKNTFDGVIVTNKEIKAELKNLTRWWNPFDEDKNPVYTKYRYSSRELYAEALSVLLNEPEKIKEFAPEFDKLFWDNIEQKPEVEDALLELHDFLNSGEEEKLISRKGDILKMFKTGEEKYFALRNEYKLRKKDPLFLMRYELIDRNISVYDKVEELQKTGYKINPEDRPDYYLEDYNYLGGKIKNLMEEIKEKVIDPLGKFDLTSIDFGEYIFLNRIAFERTDVANPLGHTQETAKKQLEFMNQNLGEARFESLKKSQEAFRGIMMKLLEESVKSGLITQEKFGELSKNPAYASFQVLDYLDDYVTPSIIKQIGTLKSISNPFASTIMKMISTKRAIERNETRKKVVEFYREHFKGEIHSAPVRRFGKYKVEVEPKEGYGIISIRQGGRLQGWYVDPYVADSVNYNSSGTNSGVIEVLRWCNSSWFRPVYINLNLGFQAFNGIRDFARAWKLNPGMTLPKMLIRYKQAAPHAFNRVWGNQGDSVIKEMQDNGMLSFTYNEIMGGNADENEQMVDYLMRRYQVTDSKEKSQNLLKRLFIYGIELLENIGNYIETLPKVAGYLDRKEAKRDMQQTAHEVRTYTGSPDFLRKGAAYGFTNQVFLFSNAIKEGLRGDYEGAFKDPRTRSGFWWKTAKINILPKVLMMLAALGIFGKYVKEIMDKATEYDKTNYTIIPIGLTPDGKAIYFRLPQDESGRLVSAMAWKVATDSGSKEPMQAAAQVGALAAGQIPSFSPAIAIPVSWGFYLFGQNPYDWFKGNTILNDDQFTAGGKYSLIPMVKWTAGQMGAYAFTIRAPENEKLVEKIIRVAPVLQRFIRITDFGEKEAERKARSNIWRQKAIRTLERRKQRQSY